jgi:hypothetical protein
MAEWNQVLDTTNLCLNKENKMKKPILFLLLIFTLAMTQIISAKTIKYVELGFNQSKFRNQDCKSKIGPSFGLGLDYYPIKNFGAFIGTELLYQNKKLLVEDKTWPTSLEPRFSNEVMTGDLDINISFLELPMQIGYSFKIKNRIFSSVFTGYSLSVPVKDHTKIKNRKVRELLPDERGKFDFDYVLVDESSVSMSKNFNIGLRLTCKRFAFLFNYEKALSFTKDIRGLNIEGKIDGYKILFALML